MFQNKQVKQVMIDQGASTDLKFSNNISTIKYLVVYHRLHTSHPRKQVHTPRHTRSISLTKK